MLFHDMWKLYEIQISAYRNEALSKHHQAFRIRWQSWAGYFWQGLCAKISVWPLAESVLIFVLDQVKVLVSQLYTTLCGHVDCPMDCIPPGFSVHGISQARILKWVAISFSRGSPWPKNWTHISCIADRFFTAEPPGKPQYSILHSIHTVFYVYM